MIRVFMFFVLCLLVVGGSTYLLSLPGSVSIVVADYVFEPSIGVLALGLIVLVGLAIFLWSIGRAIFGLPFLVARGSRVRRKERGIRALSDGFIAIYSGDASAARQLARQAGNLLEGNAAAQLLEARAAVMLGDSLEAKAHYKALIENPATAIAALTGLYEEARAQGQDRAALAFAEKASSLQPSLDWASHAVFDDLTRRREWRAGLEYLSSREGQKLFDKADLARKRGVLHTAQAMEWETSMPMDALESARDALKLIPYFVPAALIAARIYANRGEVRKASSTLARIWQQAPHPDIAELYASARQGASGSERLKRVQTLVKDASANIVSGEAVARVAIEAGEWGVATDALAPFIEDEPDRTLCTLMAQIAQGEGDDGQTRYWLGRAVGASASAAWMADGIVHADWAPVSSMTGKLDVYDWRVPAAQVSGGIDISIEADASLVEEEAGDESTEKNSVAEDEPVEGSAEPVGEKEQIKRLDDAQDNARSVF